ncbi:type II CAAX endopeptidase family protein [Caminicella sporogenes]|uniref:type II CAAX endopeptidase family protein n=1 Tax=Caminicella sporogenes TaxID=166485 RepID=UPI002541A964|nr:type II CAAX endopeptidase family protein [Caminicella sporogenes]WIF94253.1 type II CAAX endopeptidase family protein [Caminicella sporogenes]
MRSERFNILEVNLFYLVIAILLLTFGGYFQKLNIKIGLLITEYVIVLFPLLIFLKLRNKDIKKVLRLNRLRIKHAFLIIVITLFMYPVAVFFNLLMMIIIRSFSVIKPLPIPTADSFHEYIGLFFIIAISAGICEEIFFRGMLLSAYEERFGKKAIVITAFLFGIFHFNLQNLFGPVVLGLIFGYLVYLTDSIYAGIIGHITNNGLAVTLAYMIRVLSSKFNLQSGAVSENTMPNVANMIGGLIFIGIVAIIMGILAYLLIKVIREDMKIDDVKNRCDERYRIDAGIYSAKERFVHYAPLIVVFLIYVFICYIQF